MGSSPQDPPPAWSSPVQTPPTSCRMGKIVHVVGVCLCVKAEKRKTREKNTT